MLRITAAVMTTACLLACGSSFSTMTSRSEATRRSWLVIAPHPDDEVLTAAGLLARAVEAGEGVGVVVMTNGDYDCIHDGLRRQHESIAGLAALGVPEDRIFFLGYPDGGLGKLGRLPLASRRLEQGRCTVAGTTYGARGFGRRDYHSARFGKAALYTRAAAVSDLVSVISELRPSDIVVTHGSDTHPDHAATYALFRSAVDRLSEAPRVHRALVHSGDCWPTGVAPRPPCPPGGVAVSQPTPPLSGRLSGYQARERLPVPSSCRLADPDANPKVRAIAAHASQTRGDRASYLFSFARADEVFFPETYRRERGRWKAAAISNTSTPSVLSRFTAAAPETVSSRIGAAAGRYRLDIDGDQRQATLTRTIAGSGAGGAYVVQEWPLPHDLWSAQASEDFEIEIDSKPEEGAITEVTVRLRDEIVGVAVDAE